MTKEAKPSAQDYKLCVVQAFGDYQKGDFITDKKAIEEALESHKIFVVKVAI